MFSGERVSLEQAQDIVSKHEGLAVHVTSFVEVTSAGYRYAVSDTILMQGLNKEGSYTASIKTYHITLSEKSYLRLAAPLVAGHPTSIQPLMSIPTLSNLLSKILSTTEVPVPKPVAQDATGGDGRWDFGWLLLLVPPSGLSQGGTLASLRATLWPRQLARVELRLGTYLRALHNLQNEWFGRPVNTPLSPPSLPSFFAVNQGGQDGEGDEDWTRYSWQDTFVLLLEELLTEVFEGEDGELSGEPEDSLHINLEELRRYLSRALGSFLFDDVETPQLIWVTGSDEDVFVSLSHPSSSTEGLRENPDATEAEADIAYILPSLSHALWGDPLMEAFFAPPGPSQAISEGYFDGEDGRLIVFPRQRTKRVWYTVYLALIVLAEYRRGSSGEMEKMYSGKVKWAKKILPKCVKILKDAPCY
ncbi:hypothetical protein F5I97DRAFT_1964003 [Phlebopus sp. FC_14]|nr:hypothetical protein F5I97DRAFT_1964003 [Phlebopus sp. FC_14]